MNFGLFDLLEKEKPKRARWAALFLNDTFRFVDDRLTRSDC